MKNVSQSQPRLLLRQVMLSLLLFTVIVLCLVRPGDIHAQTENRTSPEVAVYAAAAEGPGGVTVDNRLLDLIRSSLALEVERAGFPTVILEEGPPQPGVHTTVLLCSVTFDGERISLDMEFTSEALPELNTRSMQEGKIDLGFDVLITRGVAQILDHVLTLAPELSGREPVSVDRREERKEEDEEEGDDEGRGGKQADPDQRDDTAVEKIPFKAWKVSVGSAPFIVVGRVNLYFNLGVLSSLRGGYTFRTRAGDIEIGLYAGLNYFSALGLETRGFNFLIPAGPSVRYGGQFGPWLQAFLSITGGPALFILKPQDEPQLMKITGYAGAGAGAGFLLGKSLGLTLEVDYFVFFEQYYPIMGIVPSIYFDIRL